MDQIPYPFDSLDSDFASMFKDGYARTEKTSGEFNTEQHRQKEQRNERQ